MRSVPDRKLKCDVHDKRAIAKSFGNAAATYNPVAGLQQRVGDNLLHLLVQTNCSTDLSRILDVGCGTGYIATRLAEKSQAFYGLDIAPEMLYFARENCQLKNVHYLCADAESIPLRENSMDIVISNFAIQWCPNKKRLFKEIARVLVPGGVFLFSMPGANTLHELKHSWRLADPDHSHVNQFCSIDDVLEELLDSSLDVVSMTDKIEVMRYDKLQELTHELKAMGAHNVTDGRAKQLTGKNTLKRLIAAYDNLREKDGKLPATWNVIYGVLSNKKTEESR